MMKRTKAWILLCIVILAMLVLGACSEQKNVAASQGPENAGSNVSNNVVETNSQENVTNTVNTEPEPEPVKKAEIVFQEQSVVYEDADGYKFEVTVKISPWILQSNSEVINEAWKKVGNGNKLPTIDSLGLSSDNTRFSRIVRNYELFRCSKSNFDMYYAVGTISIKNTTTGFDVTSSNKRSVSFYFDSETFYDAERVDCPAMGRIFFSSSIRDSGSHADFRYVNLGEAALTKNQWGPVTFVLMHGESSSPNEPEGIYRQVLKESLLRFSCYKIGCYEKKIFGPSEDKIINFNMTILD